VFRTSRHVVLREHPDHSYEYLCWECWVDICASAAIGYEIRLAKGEATRVTQ
jgi:hypothetical protein